MSFEKRRLKDLMPAPSGPTAFVEEEDKQISQEALREMANAVEPYDPAADDELLFNEHGDLHLAGDDDADALGLGVGMDGDAQTFEINYRSGRCPAEPAVTAHIRSAILVRMLVARLTLMQLGRQSALSMQSMFLCCVGCRIH